ncbi:MAG: hypothetical protein ABJZ69_12150, partial [Hyphomicrobiales bacterium]
VVTWDPMQWFGFWSGRKLNAGNFQSESPVCGQNRTCDFGTEGVRLKLRRNAEAVVKNLGPRKASLENVPVLARMSGSLDRYLIRDFSPSLNDTTQWRS